MADVACNDAHASNAVDVTKPDRHAARGAQQAMASHKTRKMSLRTARTRAMRAHISRLPYRAAIMTCRALSTDAESDAVRCQIRN